MAAITHIIFTCIAADWLEAGALVVKISLDYCVVFEDFDFVIIGPVIILFFGAFFFFENVYRARFLNQFIRILVYRIYIIVCIVRLYHYRLFRRILSQTRLIGSSTAFEHCEQSGRVYFTSTVIARFPL